MLFIRSTVFQVLFYIVTFLVMISGLVMLVLPYRWGFWVLHIWGHLQLFLLRWIVGLRVEWRGLENIPDSGYIVASKHQSAWETFALVPHFPFPTFIMKRELRWIPIFGWYIAKLRQIPINRGRRTAALIAMVEAAKEAIVDGRQIMIFPEGTRRQVGMEPQYKHGVSHIYRDLKCKVLPVALNSGLYWPRSSWIVYPGKIIVEFLPPIEPGMKPQEFHRLMAETIESASDRLCEEARSETPPSPMLEVYDRNRAARRAKADTEV